MNCKCGYIRIECEKCGRDFCPICGLDEWKCDDCCRCEAVVTQVVQVAPDPTPAPVPAAINSLTEYKRFAVKLVDKLYREHGIAFHYDTVVRRMKGSYHWLPDRRLHQICFGWNCFTFHSENGYTEYKSVTWVWGEHTKQVIDGYTTHRKMIGREAIWAIALHEFAHVVATERGVPHNRMHGPQYQQALAELIELYPYNEVKNL